MQQVTIQSNNTIIIGKDTKLTAQEMISKEVKSFKWSFDNIALIEKESNKSSLTIEPLLSGSYSIQYQAIVEIDSNQINYEGKLTIEVNKEIAIKTNIEQPKEIIEEEGKDVNPYHALLTEHIPTTEGQLPHVIKRNARYRGPRESDKVLNRNYEQAFDLRKHTKIIENQTDLLNKSLDIWFLGELGDKTINRAIKAENVYQASSQQSRYGLNSSELVSGYRDIVVKLNNELVDTSHYSIEGNDLIIDINAAGITEETAVLHISYDVIITIKEEEIQGLHALMSRFSNIDERISEMKRRYMTYENAYQ
ncbi:hypothetical protein [Oceanobacillus profundus]|uniref:Uncharacterized protein n=2 Tax=Oceanobacillus profundus TaxID=372463 RepID=A0A417YGZ3_9BACI|nr:hypothetical protein [Oceanobacillus profundus]MBR2245615.1 hypothetical protein [Bacilli bacterium]MBR3121333.1 hypothetical protein [Oceanobacillus sp.]RHW32022.1 hypothetical protein D1B32_12360 [Oceanobacillus profundus]